MVKQKIIGLLVVLCAVLWGCSSSKNTAGTRWYHGFNVRYNVFFNGQSAFNEALKNQQKTFQGNDSAMIMFPVDALPREKPTKGGPFDKVIEKSAKAIQQHSISAKPKREEGRRNDPLYKEWMARTEYNPVLHRAWMLMAKAQFHNGDFLEAAGTFAYVVRIYRTQPEIYTDALIWQAMSYTNMGWFVEAEELLAKAKRGGLPNKQMEDWHATAYADLLIQQKKYKEAIPYLNTALKAEKNGWQKKHDRQLLAQLQNAKVDNTSKTDTDTLYIPSDDNKLATYQRLKMLPVIEDSLYGDAFEAYLQGYSQLKRDAFAVKTQKRSAADSLKFSGRTDGPHKVLILYPNGTLDDNHLLYTVANFNFSNFAVSDFELEQTVLENFNSLQINGFKNFGEVEQYLKMINAADGYAAGLRKSAIIIPISEKNYNILWQGKPVEEYLAFKKVTVPPKGRESKESREREIKEREIKERETKETIEIKPFQEVKEAKPQEAKPAESQPPLNVEPLPAETNAKKDAETNAKDTEPKVSAPNNAVATPAAKPNEKAKPAAKPDPKAAAKAKAAEKAKLQKEKEAARKAKLKATAEQQKQKKKEQAAKAKAAKAAQKQKAKDRAAAQKKKEKDRKAAQKQKEKDRAEAQKLKAEQAKAKKK